MGKRNSCKYFPVWQRKLPPIIANCLEIDRTRGLNQFILYDCEIIVDAPGGVLSMKDSLLFKEYREIL